MWVKRLQFVLFISTLIDGLTVKYHFRYKQNIPNYKYHEKQIFYIYKAIY